MKHIETVNYIAEVRYFHSANKVKKVIRPFRSRGILPSPEISVGDCGSMRSGNARETKSRFLLTGRLAGDGAAADFFGHFVGVLLEEPRLAFGKLARFEIEVAK